MAIIVDKTKIVRGKYTFVISDAEPTREDDAEDSELANKFHGNKATNKNTEYGILLEALVGIRKIMEKAKDMTNIWASGFKITQK